MNKNRLQYAILFSVIITLHNLEEALWLPAWSQQAPFIPAVSNQEFYVAIMGISVLAYLSALFFVRLPKNRVVLYIFVGFTGAMLINAFFPHIILTIFTKTYAPGVATSVLLILPMYAWMLWRLYQEAALTMQQLVLSTAGIGILLVVLIPLLYQASHIL